MNASRPQLDEIAIERIAERICGLGLGAAAVFFLELHKPLCGLVKAGLTVVEPSVGIFVGRERVQRLGALFESAQQLERLIKCIENRETCAGANR